MNSTSTDLNFTHWNMDKKSSGKFISLLKKIDAFASQEYIPDKYGDILRGFSGSYKEVIIEHGEDPDNYIDIFTTFIDLIEDQFRKPHKFKPYHEKIRAPFDYYNFGLDFLRPLVDLPHSTVSGMGELDKMEEYIEQKENVIVFAKHQIEADPQAISILLERSHPNFGENLIFVAGTRVTSDPLAIPFSLGRNLLCINSKKYIDNPPDEQHEKQMHNKRTMERMVELLSEGGHAIYVAPSGGRDRANTDGIIEVTPFDPQSVEMFYLMAQKAKSNTHFFPLALSTYHLLPPPRNNRD